MGLPLIIIGAGGHGKVVCDAALAGGHEVTGFTDGDPASAGRAILGRPVLGADAVLAEFAPDAVLLSLGVGDIGVRARLFGELSAAGYAFAVIVHPAAVVAASATLGSGAQVLAQAVVQANAELRKNSVVNTGAIVEHDCRLGDHGFVAPGAILLGGVTVGSRAMIGAGAVVLPGRAVGADAVVGAGAVVAKDVPDGATVVGVPAS
ncbi:MAG: acetyltransferase [Rickettsiales bacterium]